MLASVSGKREPGLTGSELRAVAELAPVADSTSGFVAKLGAGVTRGDADFVAEVSLIPADGAGAGLGRADVVSAAACRKERTVNG